MSMTTRAARSADPLSMPSRVPGPVNQPSSSASRSAYKAQPSPCPLTNTLLAYRDSVSPAIMAAPACRWWPGTPSWKTVESSDQVWNLSASPRPASGHQVRPGRVRSSLGFV